MRKRRANRRCCLPWLLLLLLAACRPQAQLPLGSGGTQAISAVETPAATETKSPPVAASPSLQVTVIHPVPSLNAVQTPTTPSCDPRIGYCLYPYLSHLHPPLLPKHWTPPAATYRYGQTQNGQRAPHHGLDFPVPFGTAVLAAAEGKVLFAGPDQEPRFAPWPNFYGNLIVLEHSLPDMQAPFYTLYGHLSAIEVVEGETVRAGQVIGKVGMSGVAIGSHLHFEVRSAGLSYADTRNPELWLPLLSPQTGLLIGRLEDGRGHPLHFHLSLQAYSPDGKGTAWTEALETYSLQERLSLQSDVHWQENFTRGDLPPGNYRLSLIRNGSLIERRFVIQAGQITYLVITVP